MGEATGPEGLPNIAMMPTAGMGHLIPLAQFARRLVARHRLAVTILLPSDKPPTSAETSVLDSLPSAVRHRFLPPVSTDDIRRSSPDVRIETLMSHIVVRSLPFLRSALRASRAAALVVDLFGTDAIDAADELGIPAYVFYPSTAACLWFAFHLPELDGSVSEEYRDMTRPVCIPGCTPLRGADLLDPVQDRKNDAYKWFLHHAKGYRRARGVVLNSFPELEPGPVKSLLEFEPGRPPVYPVGPLVQSSEGSGCLRWLDGQPHGSVIFVSFGSGGVLSHEQTTELAWGLEQSGQRFIWVVRKPNGSLGAAYFLRLEEEEEDRFGFLPSGFLDRVRDRGLVLWSWAPQSEILAHPAVGGFLTHCGWNSTLESVVCGVPMIAWPLYAEQRMNAHFLAEDVKVAIRAKYDEPGLVRRSEVADLAMALMEGEEGKGVRRRIKTLQDSAARVLGEDGSSTRSLDHLARTWKTLKNLK